MKKLTAEEKIKIVEMKLEDDSISSRKIAKALWGKNCRKSTINDWLKSEDYCLHFIDYANEVLIPSLDMEHDWKAVLPVGDTDKRDRVITVTGNVLESPYVGNLCPDHKKLFSEHKSEQQIIMDRIKEASESGIPQETDTSNFDKFSLTGRVIDTIDNPSKPQSSEEIVNALNQVNTYKKRDGAYDLGENILVISDTHFPYHHPKTFDFLEMIKDKYSITGVVHVGDLCDMHTVSYHENVYGSLSPSEEYEQGKQCLQQLEKLFPEMLVIRGNHGALNARKAQSAGIPQIALKDENSLYELNGGWLWGDNFMFWAGDKKCLLTHGIGQSVQVNATKFSHCSVSGHHHSVAGVSYFKDFEQQRWAMSVGCLIDDTSPVFAYNKSTAIKRPVISCGLIINGVPSVIPLEI